MGTLLDGASLAEIVTVFGDDIMTVFGNDIMADSRVPRPLPLASWGHPLRPGFSPAVEAGGASVRRRLR